MEKKLIATGKNIELAIAAALEELQLDRDSVQVEVLENAKPGFLGIGASPARIQVTYEVPDEPAKPAPALSGASRTPKKQAPKLATPPEQPREEKKPAPAAPKAARPEPKKQAPKAEEAPKQPAKEYAPAPAGSQEEQVELFLKGLLEHMGSDAVPHAFRKEEDTIGVELVGDRLGMLIGRRGETLDAIQHLANYALNRDANKRTRVTIDAENYRGKREEALQRLAHKVASKVIKYRRNMTLEPMNAYERHVIHAALQDGDHVTTFSTGTEPNRRIVVAYED